MPVSRGGVVPRERLAEPLAPKLRGEPRLVPLGPAPQHVQGVGEAETGPRRPDEPQTAVVVRVVQPCLAGFADPATMIFWPELSNLDRSGVFLNRLEALRSGLRDLGYVEGKNILIE